MACKHMICASDCPCRYTPAASEDHEPVGAGISRPEREPCKYGVSRELCHVGCGMRCRLAR